MVLFAIAIDSDGNIHVDGDTTSEDFPTIPGAFDTSCGFDGNCSDANDDVFISKLDPDLSAPTPSPTISPTLTPTPTPGPSVDDDEVGGCNLIAGNVSTGQTMASALTPLIPAFVIGFRRLRRKYRSNRD